MPAQTPYDEIAYPTRAFRQTHPDRLAVHAALFGLPFAPPGACRILEIGCGDGANIIPMADRYPGSVFVGFDLSSAAIARGREIIGALGLANIQLLALDLIEADFGAGGFDYVIAHGLYSWTPAPVREALMASIRRHLAPHGVAFVSYNALPGGRIGELVRDMLLFHLRDVDGPTARLAEGRRYLERLVEGYADDDPLERVIKIECRSLLARPPEVLAHDELGEVYAPLHLHQFLAHAAAHGLQFLTEASPTRCGEGFRPPYALDQPDFDVPAHAQALDFKALRSYRQTLLVDAGVALDRRPDPGRLLGLYATTTARRTDDGRFQAGTSSFDLPDASLRALVERLCAAWPAAPPVAELLDGVADARAGALLRMYWTGLIELHAEAAPHATTIGERPKASAMARLQAARGGPLITTARHAVAEIKDQAGLGFIAGLDGARTIDQLAADMAAELGQPAGEVRPVLQARLNDLLRLPLLV